MAQKKKRWRRRNAMSIALSFQREKIVHSDRLINQKSQPKKAHMGVSNTQGDESKLKKKNERNGNLTYRVIHLVNFCQGKTRNQNLPWSLKKYLFMAGDFLCFLYGVFFPKSDPRDGINFSSLKDTNKRSHLNKISFLFSVQVIWSKMQRSREKNRKGFFSPQERCVISMFHTFSFDAKILEREKFLVERIAFKAFHLVCLRKKPISKVKRFLRLTLFRRFHFAYVQVLVFPVRPSDAPRVDLRFSRSGHAKQTVFSSFLPRKTSVIEKNLFGTRSLF